MRCNLSFQGICCLLAANSSPGCCFLWPVGDLDCSSLPLPHSPPPHTPFFTMQSWIAVQGRQRTLCKWSFMWCKFWKDLWGCCKGGWDNQNTSSCSWEKKKKEKISCFEGHWDGSQMGVDRAIIAGQYIHSSSARKRKAPSPLKRCLVYDDRTFPLGFLPWK